MGAIGGAMATDGAEGADVDGRGGEDEARCGPCVSRDVVMAEDETSMDLDAGLRGGLVGAVKARARELVTASGEEIGGEVGRRKVDVPETETGVVRPPEPEERCLAWVPLSEELPLTMMSWSNVMSSRSRPEWKEESWRGWYLWRTLVLTSRETEESWAAAGSTWNDCVWHS